MEDQNKASLHDRKKKKAEEKQRQEEEDNSDLEVVDVVQASADEWGEGVSQKLTIVQQC